MASYGGNTIQVMSKDEFLETIKTGLVVVFFFSSDSDSSKVARLNFDDLAKAYSENTFLKVDIYDLPAVADYADVCAVPSFYVYRQGVVHDQYIGSIKSKLQILIEHNLGFK